MKRIILSTEAEEELDEAAAFYDEQRNGLGDRFYRAVRDVLSKVQANPSTGFPSAKGTRTGTVKKFPFGVVFREYPDYVFVVAVGHSSRREDYWAVRIEDEESP